MNIDLYSIITLLIVLTALFSYLNTRYIKLPATIGMMLIAMLCSMALIGIGHFYPAILERPVAMIRSLDFESLLMNIMLSFLLFAGAIHIDLAQLKKELVPVIVYSTIGVLISTALIGIGMYFVFGFAGISMPVMYCLLFGALISPTDPIAVLGILKKAGIPPSLETKISGESLFNDGVGVVVFITILEIAQAGIADFTIGHTAFLFLTEAGGGIIWGLILGYAGLRLMRSIDHYQVEVLITLALVMGGYLLAAKMHISGPLAMVVAGIIIGNKGKEAVFSDITQDYVNKFWELVDEILNAVLFLLIGLEMLLLKFDKTILLVGIIAIALVLIARYISLFIPTLALRIRLSFERHMIPILTWGGLRGGISVALALSLPKEEHRDVLVSVTYIIVVFSILVQGLTIGKLARKLQDKKNTPN